MPKKNGKYWMKRSFVLLLVLIALIAGLTLALQGSGSGSTPTQPLTDVTTTP